MSDRLWVVCAIANPMGFNSRMKLYRDFVQHVLADLRLNMVTVECSYGASEPELADVGRRFETDGVRLVHVAVHANSIMWHKENLLNIACDHVPQGVPYICWCDADLTFMEGADAVPLMLRALEAHPAVQCFSTCLDMGPGDASVLKVHHSYAKCSALGAAVRPGGFETAWHSGYVWAAHRSLLSRTGGLWDVGIVGSGDRVMALAFTGNVDEYKEKGFGADYTGSMREWQARALEVTGGKVGYAPLTIMHHFHGSKKDRQYGTRGAMLKASVFSPAVDLVKNGDGVYEWAAPSSELPGRVVQYFQDRREDAT